MEDKKILEEIRGQNKKIMDFMVQQNQNFNELRGGIGQLKDTMNDRFNRVESVVLENSKDIKEVKTSLNTAITNHEQRIRKVETKIGI